MSVPKGEILVWNFKEKMTNQEKFRQTDSFFFT